MQVDYLNDEQLVVDMNDLKFPVDSSMQERSALLFIRNTNLKGSFDFSGCSYERKELFLMLYMTEAVQVYVPELIHTWVAIIGNKYVKMDVGSILSLNEIDAFIANHQELVNEMINITGSIPICSIYSFLKSQGINCQGEYEISEYIGINARNYFNLLSDNNFIKLIELIDDIHPKYYVNYFVEDTSYYASLLYKLPYLSLLTAAFLDDESRAKFISNLIDSK